MPLDQPASPPPPRTPQTDDAAMPLGDHLDELRRRLIYALLGVAAALVVTAVFGLRIATWVMQPLLQAQDVLGLTPQLIVTDPTAGFTTVYFPVVLVAAAVLACPWIFYQFWRFVSVGLYRHERKAVYLLVPFSTLLTALALAFTYYILLPVSLLFFMNFATLYPPAELTSRNPIMGVLASAYAGPDGRNDPMAPPDGTVADPVPLPASLDRLPSLPVLDAPPAGAADGAVWIDRTQHRLMVMLGGRPRHVPVQSDHLINPLPQAGHYIKFACFMTLTVAGAFQLPVAMLILGFTGLMDAGWLARQRRYALFVAVILSAIATPADPLSMFLLAVPLYSLFEVGLLCMRLARRRAGEAEAGERVEG